MKQALIAIVMTTCAGCSKPDPQRQDLEAFCSLDAAARTSLNAFGAALEPKLHEGTAMHTTIMKLKRGRSTLREAEKDIRQQLIAEHISDCPAMQMFDPKPTTPAP